MLSFFFASSNVSTHIFIDIFRAIGACIYCWRRRLCFCASSASFHVFFMHFAAWKFKNRKPILCSIVKDMKKRRRKNKLQLNWYWFEFFSLFFFYIFRRVWMLRLIRRQKAIIWTAFVRGSCQHSFYYFWIGFDWLGTKKIVRLMVIAHIRDQNANETSSSHIL